jgi:hypothetical protein
MDHLPKILSQTLTVGEGGVSRMDIFDESNINFYGELDIARLVVEHVLSPPKLNIPQVLYHYTDANALRCILETGALRATAIPYLNDKTEGEYGTRMFRESFERIQAGHRPLAPTLANPIRVYLDYRAGNLAGPDNQAAVAYKNTTYVCCFSERIDLLSQWRGYGAGGYGYAVGFDTNGLAKWLYQCNGLASLRRVTYDAKKHARMTTSAIRTYNKRIFQFESANPFPSFPRHPNPYSLLEARMQCTMLLHEHLIPVMKHDAFHEKQEWRIIDHNFNNAREYFSRNGLIVPFVSLKSDMGARLPISKIIVGPCVDFNKAAASLRLLLWDHDYIEHMPAIERSGVPLSP